jgi:fimbrial chaperone protein
MEKIMGFKCLCGLLLIIYMSCNPVLAANYSVGPVVIELGKGVKTASLKISNDDSKPLYMQVRLFSWAQNDEGKSVYQADESLVFFPHTMTIQPKDSRLVRVGIKVPASSIEKSYVLFLEELLAPVDNQAPAEDRNKGTVIGIATRFGVPVYLKPLKEHATAVISPVSLTKGKASVAVSNTGNVSLSIPKIQFYSADYLSEYIPGGVILAGATRRFNMTIPQDVCNKLDKLDVTVKTRSPPLQFLASTLVNNAQCQ